MTTRTIAVPAIQCDHCKTSIEGALLPLEGVRWATVNVAAGQVTVDYDEAMISPDVLVASIEEQGYDVPAQE